MKNIDYDLTAIDEQAMATFRYIVDWVKSTDKLPSVRSIAKGRGQSISATRRHITQMEGAGMIRRTIHGFAPPKGWKPDVATRSA